MLKREMVGPRNFVSRLAAIPQDGNDWEIVWESGRYDWATLLRQQGVTTPLNFVHPTGKIVMRARGDVRIAPPDASATYDGVSAFLLRTFNIVGSDIYVHGFTIEGEETPINWAVGETQSFRRFTIIAGNGYRDSVGNFPTEHAIAPTRIHFSDMDITGRTVLWANCSADPTVYTEAIFDNIYIRANAQNGALLLNGDIGGWTQPLDTGCYAHARFEDISGYAISGPDSTVHGTPWVNSSHSEGGAAITMNPRFAGDSTVEIHRLRWHNTLMGSLNHDGHAVQLVGPHGSSSYVLLRDCSMTVEWAAGHLNGNAGGGGIMWPLYGHAAIPNYPTSPRPRWDVEGCYFEGIIRGGVLQPPGGSPGADPNRSLINVRNSGDWHLWDCHFKWEVPAAYANDLYALRVQSNYITSAYHSCTFDFGGNPIRDPYYASGALVGSTHTVDNETRQFGGHTPVHGRPMPAEYGMLPEDAHTIIPYSSADMLNGEGSFDDTLSLLTLSGTGASVGPGTGVVDGANRLALVSRYSPGGDIAVNGGFESGDLTGWDNLGTNAGVSSTDGTHSGTWAGYLQQFRSGLGGNYGSSLTTELPSLRGVTHDISFWVDSYTSPYNLNIYADLDGDGTFETPVDILTATTGFEEKTYALVPTADHIGLLFTIGIPAAPGTYRWLLDDLVIDIGAPITDEAVVTTGTLTRAGGGHYLSSSACVTPDALASTDLEVYVDEADGLGFKLMKSWAVADLTAGRPNPVLLTTSEPVPVATGQAAYRLKVAAPLTIGSSIWYVDAWRVFYGMYESSRPPLRNVLDPTFTSGWSGGSKISYYSADATPLLRLDNYAYEIAPSSSATFDWLVDVDTKAWDGSFYFAGWEPYTTSATINWSWKVEWISGTWGDITLVSGTGSAGATAGGSGWVKKALRPAGELAWAVPPPGSLLRLTVAYNSGGSGSARLLIDAPAIG